MDTTGNSTAPATIDFSACAEWHDGVDLVEATFAADAVKDVAALIVKADFDKAKFATASYRAGHGGTVKAKNYLADLDRAEKVWGADLWTCEVSESFGRVVKAPKALRLAKAATDAALDKWNADFASRKA